MRHTCTLSRYLQEKDVFEKYYKQHLGKRLLSGRTMSDDAERNLLIKLKTECGYQFTSKLEGMFTDIKTSRDMMLDFRAKLAAGGAASGPGNAGPGPSSAAAAGAAAAVGEAAPGAGADSLGGIDMQVQVLTTGSWPTQACANCNLPRELERCCEEFKTFYLGTHSGRKLTWQVNMGTADLRASFAKGAKRHELTVTTYQMCILLLFNEVEQMSYQEIAQATEIPSADLKRALQGLACVKGKSVLRKEPVSVAFTHSPCPRMTQALIIIH